MLVPLPPHSEIIPGQLPQAEFVYFRASDGANLLVRRWPAAGVRRATIVALHGIQSHSGWYRHSSRTWSQSGFDVWLPDRRGSGLNLSHRGDTPHPDRLIHDVTQMLESLRPTNQPIVLMGISWGGKLAAAVAARRPDLVQALALLYPGIYSRIQPTRWKRLKLRTAKMLSIRNKLVKIPLNDPTLFTSDPVWQAYIQDDSLALHQVTSRFLYASEDLDEEVRQQPVGWCQFPALLLQAGEDAIVDNDRTRDWFMSATGGRGEVHVYDQARHTLEFESSSQHFVTDTLNWLKRVSANGAPA